MVSRLASLECWNEELETLMPTNRAENVATNFKLRTLHKNGPMKTRCMGWAGKVLSTFTEKVRRVGRTERRGIFGVRSWRAREDFKP